MASVTKRETANGVRYDVRYRTPERKVRTKTFRRKVDADRYANEVETDIARGDFVDPRRGRKLFGEYATDWVNDRPKLKPRTRDEYRRVLRLHIAPTFSTSEMRAITPGSIRAWHAALTRADKPGPATVAKAYRLMHAIMNTAAFEDTMISRNPCTLEGAGTEDSAERSIIEPGAVLELADAVKPERRPMVLLAGFCGLRLGEILGLRAKDIDLAHKVVHVCGQLQELPPHGTQTFTKPKSKAGTRDVPLPDFVAGALGEHMEGFLTGTGWLFTGDKGGPLRRHVWNAEWRAARASVGMNAVRFHDLRHTALTAFATHGATTKELMRAAGHSTMNAAIRYQHAVDVRMEALAERMQASIVAASHEESNVRAINAR